MFKAFVRAKTSDDRWASVDIVDLDERSFRRFIVSQMVGHELLCGMGDSNHRPLTTPLTKAEVERDEKGQSK